jgi:hypothetical protein
MSWVVQAVLFMVGITAVFELIIMGIYKITSHGKDEE